MVGSTLSQNSCSVPIGDHQSATPNCLQINRCRSDSALIKVSTFARKGLHIHNINTNICKLLLYLCLGCSVFESLFQIILIWVLSLSLGSIEMMGIPFFWIQLGFGSPAGQSLFTIWNSFQAKEKNQNGYISLTLARNEKIRPLYFIQLLKLNKTKWSYFFNLS